jgi:hypothetical protein
MEFVKPLSVLVPIVGLLVTGFVITARSGVSNLSKDQELRQMVWNLSEAILLLAGCGLSFLVLQQLSGVPMGILG